MKTQSLLWSFALICLGCIASQAQEYEYVPLVREGIEWVHKNGEVYRFDGDVVIKGKTYKELNNNSHTSPGAHTPSGYAREENGIVYRLISKNDEEIPIYDFNVKQAGDIMQAVHTETGKFGMKVERVDSILINGKYRKRIKVEGQQGECIEGIGCTEPGYSVLSPFYQNTSVFDEKTKNKLAYVLNFVADKIEWKRPDEAWVDQYEYVPLVREGIEWGYSGDLGEYRCQIKGDTIIDGVAYKKFYKYTTCELQDNTPCCVVVREEDKKVYYREISGEDRQERMIYDFSLEMGDSELLYNRVNSEYMTTNVFYTDTIQVGSTYRKRLSYLIHDVIEGIGGLGNDWLVAAFTIAPCVPDCNIREYLDYVKNLATGEYEYGHGGECVDYEYIPFVKTADWTYYDAEPGDGVTTFPRYHLSGDESERVTVNGRDYYRLYSYTGCDFNTADTRRELALVREEAQKVYVLDSIEGTYVDKLLYDFTLNVGDTLRMDEGSYFHRPEAGDDWNDIAGRKRCNDRYQRDVSDELDSYSGFKVTSIEPIVVAGKPRKAIHWNNGNTWVVGLGEISEYPLAQFYMDYSTCVIPPFYLLYQKSNGEYTYEVLDLHRYTPDPCLSGIDESKADALRIARTPDALVVTLPGSGYRLAELIDTTGRLVWCEYLDGEPGEVIIPTTALSSGIYVVALTDNRGERTAQKVGW